VLRYLNIPDNEVINKVAKAKTALPTPPGVIGILVSLKRLAKARANNSFRQL